MIKKDYALCQLDGVNFAAENCTRTDAVNGVGAGFHLSPASGMPTNREANAVANATVKPRIAFAPICNPSKGEYTAATALNRDPIAGGEIGKSENRGKHREVSRTKTGNGSREAADESRMSGKRSERGMTAFSAITANLARTEADEVRFYFIKPTKGQPTMKTKLDTMNHAQRAAFARSLYHRPTMTRNAVTAANAYGIREAK